MDRKSFRYFICGLLTMALFMTTLPVYANGSGGTTTAYDRIVSAITGNNPNTNLSNINAQLAAMNTKLENIASTVDGSSSTTQGVFSIIGSGYLSGNKITATQRCLVKLINISASGIYVALNNEPSSYKYDLGAETYQSWYFFSLSVNKSYDEQLHYKRFIADLTSNRRNTNYWGDTALVLMEPGDYLQFSSASSGIYYVIYSLE